MVDNDLGFAAKRTDKLDALDLSGFKPVAKKPKSAKEPTPQDDEIVDRVAERAGFTSREPTQRVERKRRSREPTDQVFVRAPISVMNAFRVYCDETDQTYGEAIADLMKIAKDTDNAG